MNKRRIIYMGTPDFAVPPLTALLAEPEYRPAAVVTQQDRAAGRGRRIHKPSVKQAVAGTEITVLQPTALKRGRLRALLAPYKPDLIITCAYGRLLPDDVLSLPGYGCINIHASLLPRHRGSSPIHAAVLAGDKVSGITYMAMSSGMDEGDILEQHTIPLTPEHTTERLFHELSELAARKLISFLNRYFAGDIRPVPQDPSQATYAGLLSREDGALDFAQPPDRIDRLVRGLYSWPGAFAFYQGKRFKILAGKPLSSAESARLPSGQAGEILAMKGRFIVQAGPGHYEILRYQPAGSRVLTATEGAHNLKAGEVLRKHPAS